MALSTEAALRKDRTNAKGDLNGILQHRHFAVIAGIIAEIEDPLDRGKVAVMFCTKLAGTNSRFDRKRFLRACGIADA